MAKHVNLDSAIRLLKAESEAARQLWQEYKRTPADHYIDWRSESATFTELHKELVEFRNELCQIAKSKGRSALDVPYPKTW